MDNELDELEAELKRLDPAPVSSHLEARIAAEMAPVIRAETGKPAAIGCVIDLRWLWAAGLAAAAIVTLMFLVRSRPRTLPESASGVAASAPARPESISAGAELKPVADESVLVSARDEGVVTLDDGTRARRQRLEFVETITWKNPRTNASLIWSMPREEVRVVPISFQ